MKRLTPMALRYACVLTFLFAAEISTSQPFITTWKTDNPGSSNNTSITIPTIGGGYSYNVDWDNDGIYDEFSILGDVTHDFGAPGTYTIRIDGAFPRIYFNNGGDKDKILSIDQWGSIAWTNMESAFYGCTNLVCNAFDTPNLSSVTSMRQAFREATSFNSGNMNNWNVSNVTDMSQIFYDAVSFNSNISNWDVSNVTSMERMFRGATSFQGGISLWNVSNVVNMEAMFLVTSFNGDISMWDVSSVTNMIGMFGSASFNSDVSGWNVSNVTNMRNMFDLNSAFSGDLSAWDVSNVTNMSRMFNSASSFDSDLSNWTVDNVTNMDRMFSGASSFSSDVSNWNVSNVTDMTHMFQFTNAFNSDLSMWNVANVEDMTNMFRNASAFDQNLGSWDLSGVVSLEGISGLEGMLNNCAMSVANYDSTLIGWESQGVFTHNLGAQGLAYCRAAAERESLINNYNWNIAGDSYAQIPEFVEIPTDMIFYTSDANPGECQANLSLNLPGAITCWDEQDLDLVINFYSPPGALSPSLVINSGPGSIEELLLDAGEYLVEYILYDPALESNTTSFFISVVDDEDPSLSSCSDISVPCISNTCAADVLRTIPTPSDNCFFPSDLVYVIIDFADGSSDDLLEPGGSMFNLSYPVGVSTITYEFYDSSFNVTSCVETVTVNDIEPPQVSCPADITIGTSTSSDLCMGFYNLIHPFPFENCLLSEYTLEYTGANSSGGPFAVSEGSELPLDLELGTTTFSYFVSDDSGNSSSCMFTVTVEDDLPPEWVGLPDLLEGECGVDDLQSLLEPYAGSLTDGCSNASFSFIPIESMVCGNATQGFLEITVTDEASNTAVFELDFELNDLTPPILDVDDPIVVNCTIDEIPTLSASAEDVCQGSVIPTETIDINETATETVFTYTWTATDDCGNSSTATSQVTVTNDYDVTITDENGDDVPVFICPGEAIEIFAISDDIIEEYIWSTGEQTESIQAMAGEYSVTATTSNGCFAEATVILTEGVSFQVNISQTPDDWECGVDAVTLIASTDLPDGANYIWSTGESGESIEVDAAGVYTVTATEIGGSECSGIAEYTLSNPDNSTPVVTIMPYANLSCENVTVELIATSENSEDEFVWMVDPPVNSNSLTVTDPGDYRLVVTGPNNCDTAITVSISGNTSPAALEFEATEITCSAAATISLATPIQGSWSFMWTGPGDFMSDQQNIEVNLPGEYEVTVIDTNQCDSTYVITVESNTAAPVVTIENGDEVTITCFANTIELRGLSEPDTAGTWYLNDEEYLANSRTVNADLTTAGEFKYVVTNSGGCSDSASVVVSIDTIAPDLTMSSTVDCDLDVAILTSVPQPIPTEFSFEWEGPNGFESTLSKPWAMDRGKYFVTVTDDNGCFSMDTTVLDNDIRQTELFINTTKVVSGNDGEAWLEITDGVGPFDINWVDGNVDTLFGTTDTVYNVPFGSHYLTVTDANECTDRFNWLMNADPAICDFSSILISTQTRISNSLKDIRTAPRSILNLPCLDTIFNNVEKTDLYYESYFFEVSMPGEPITLEFLPLSTTYDSMRAFVLTCDPSGSFSKQQCEGVTTPDQFTFIPDQEFYYIVVAGTSASNYEFILKDRETITVCEAQQDSLACGDLIFGDASQRQSQFSVALDSYTDCYSESRTYEGGEQVYRIELDSLVQAEFLLYSSSDLGAFLFDYRCSNRCIAAFETSESNDTAIQSIRLNPGIYFLVIDWNEQEGSGTYDIGMSCVKIENQQPWPNRLDERSPPNDSCLNPDIKHVIRFDTGLIKTGEIPLDLSMPLVLSVMSPSRTSAVGAGIPTTLEILTEEGAELNALADKDYEDGFLCGFDTSETIFFGLYDGENRMTFAASTRSGLPLFKPGKQDSVYEISLESSIIYESIHPAEHASVTWDGEETSVVVFSSQKSWEIETPNINWITDVGLSQDLSQKEGFGTQKVTIRHEHNCRDTARTATIEVTFDDGTHEVFKLIQKPKPEGEPCTSGTEDLPGSDMSYRIYPNPATNSATIEILHPTQRSVSSLHISNSVGQIVRRYSAALIDHSTIEIDLSGLPSGMYNVTLMIDGTPIGSKLAIIN